MAAEKQEHLFKIVVIGPAGAGKSSLIKRYVHHVFSQHYKTTMGVDFALKVLEWDSENRVRLQLWDIAGQDRFCSMMRVYFKDSVGAFIVFDITKAASFEEVQKWKRDLDVKAQLADGSPIPAVLLANKCDLLTKDKADDRPEMDRYCKDEGFISWFETSAKENINIDEAARVLVTKILANEGSKLPCTEPEDTDGPIALEDRKKDNSACC